MENTNANDILESLNAAELRTRLDALEKERRALRILHRAALNLERKQVALSNEKQASGRGGAK